MEDVILVVGLGSPIMSDDAVGLHVARAIKDMDLEKVKVIEEAVGGLDIIHVLMDHRQAILVDAIMTGLHHPGSIAVMDPEDFDRTVADASAHEMNLTSAMYLGRQLEPERMPERVRFVAIEVKDLITVSEEMTPDVQASVPEAIQVVLELIAEMS